MEISGISTSSTWSYTGSTSSASSTLTDEQKTTLESILANYDLENMEGDDIDSLMEEIKDSGIEMNEETEEILAEAGLEKPDDMPPPGDMPPPDEVDSTTETEEADATDVAATSSTEEDEEIDEDLLDLIEQYQNGSITEEEFLQQAATYGATGSAGSIVNQYA
jgi:hypothetical protein